ncbi:hypothetical protein [Spirosoma gilvum]
MEFEMRLEWAEGVKSTLEPMDGQLRESIIEGIKQQAQKSLVAYQQRPDDLESIYTVSHIQIPNRNLWFELATQYYVEAQEAIFLVRSIHEVSVAEVMQQKMDGLEQLKKLHIDRAYKMMNAYNRSLYPFDLFAAAVYKRSMSLIDGFLKMIPSNFICAAPLVRLQVDNLLRFYAAQRVSVDVHDFALEVMGGTAIKDMRDKDNPKQKLTDAYLVQLFKQIEPRIEPLYKSTSGYIHLSEKHFYNSFTFSDKEGGIIEGCVSESDQFITDEERLEAIVALTVITDKLLWLLDSWTFVKNNPVQAKEAWDKGHRFIAK